MTADEALRQQDVGTQPALAQTEAEEWLRNILAEGPMLVSTVQDRARVDGISWATLRRAQSAIPIAKRKLGMDGGWEWSMASKVLKHAEDAHQNSLSAFDYPEHLRTETLSEVELTQDPCCCWPGD